LIGIVMATEMEAEPFIRSAQLHDADAPFPIHATDSYTCIISGIGKANAAMAVGYGYYYEKITTFVNLGAAGAVRQGFNLGDIFMVESVCELDRPTILERKNRFLNPQLLDGFQGVSLSTRDIAAVTGEERALAAQVAELADMEGAGFLQGCDRFGCRGYIFKVITDRPGDDDPAIIKNVLETRENLYSYFMEKIFPVLKGD
jgi:nucleoside phosphorylase